MKWTKQLPDTEGFYWMCLDQQITMVRVFNLQGQFFVTEDRDRGGYVDDPLYHSAYWNGPIQPPEFNDQ